MDAYKDHPARKTRPGGPQGREPSRGYRRAGATRSRPRRRESTRSTSPTAAATTGPQCPQGSPWKIADRRHRDPATKTPSATRASRSGTCSRAGASPTSCSWACIPTCACSAGRSGCGSLARSRQERGPGPRPDRHDVQLAELALRQPFRGDQPDRRAHREVRLPRRSLSTDLTGQPAFRFQPDDRPRAVFLIGEDEYKTEKTLPAFADQGARAAGHALHVRDRRPQVAARLPGDRGSQRRRPAGPERSPPRTQGRGDGDHPPLHRGRQAARRHPDGLPCLRHPRQGTGGPRRMDRHSIPTSWAAITPGIMPTTLKPTIDRAPSSIPGSSDPGGRRRRRSPARARSTRPVRWRPRPSLCLIGQDPGPARRAGRLGQPQGHVAGLLHVAGPSRRFREARVPPACSSNAVFWALDRQPAAQASERVAADRQAEDHDRAGEPPPF